MKQLLLIFAIIVQITSYAQLNHSEISPDIDIENSTTVQSDTLNLQFSFPCTAFIGEYGVESNGNDIYVTQWLDDSIVKYDIQGNIIEKFTISEVGRIRDLAYDGQYYYGSPNDFFFYVLDLDNKILVEKVYTSFKIRGLAYDALEDLLWATEHWLPMFYKMDKDGNILDSWMSNGITLDAISGLAYDNDSPDGPFLWGFSQDSTGAIIVKYDIATQSQTGNMIDVSGLVSGNSVAGGLFINEMPVRSGVTLGGCIQNNVVFALDLDYANQMVVGTSDNIINSIKVYPNPVSEQLNIWLPEGSFQNLELSIISYTGQVVLQKTYSDYPSSGIKIEMAGFKPGKYLIRLNDAKNYSVIKSFVVAN